jgi:glucosylceramidase
MTPESLENHSQPEAFNVEMWLTRGDQSALCAKQPRYLTVGSLVEGCPTIKVSASRRYQVMDGFGFALTGGSADLIGRLAPDTRDALLRELLLTTDGGIGITYLRISIGASDLSSASFTYDDLPAGQTDPGLERFGLAAGDTQMIPILREILAIYPDIGIIATPWTAPPWMKSNQSLTGGSLRREYYQVYAKYIVTYLKKMRSFGIRIKAITPQNEPLNLTDDPSMGMSAVAQADFIRDHLGPALHDTGLSDVAIFCYDHNCDRPDYPIAVLDDVETRQFVAGVAWHLYGGRPTALSKVARKHPGIKTYFTEQWVQAGGQFGDDLIWHVRNVLIGTIRNGAQAVLEWNLAGDPDNGPHTPGGSDQSLGALTIGASTITRNLSYYVIAHLSRFVRPGSMRVSSTSVAALPNVAFSTPDGKAVLLVLNGRSDEQKFNIQFNGRNAATLLMGNSVATFVWQLGSMPSLELTA